MCDAERSEIASNVTSDTLVFAHVIFRHGERNILHGYQNDPYKDASFWPEGFGCLTNKGKRQLHALGQYLRKRYNGLISRSYSPNEIYIFSTDSDRTLMSAQACLAGMYPPTAKERWSEEIMWHPIPVHTIPNNIDMVLSLGKNRAKHSAAREHYLKTSPEIQCIYTEHADLFKYWSRMSGANITTIGDVRHIYDTLTIEKERFGQLEDWAEEAIKPNGTMEYIAIMNSNSKSATRQLAKLQSGYLIKEMIERFKQKIDKSLEPDRSLWLYSAHDATISNLLASLGLFDMKYPPFASSLHFELYKSSDDMHYLQIFYRKSNEDNPLPMKIPGCGDKCTLEKFLELYDRVIPDAADDSSCSAEN